MLFSDSDPFLEKSKCNLNIISVMCAAKNKLTRFELHWLYILPHINIWS